MNQQPGTRQNGFSLVEIMIATMILSFGLLAMAASTGYVSRQLGSSIFDSQRTHAKEQIIERLRGTAYTSVLDNNTPTAVGRFSMTWQITLGTNYKTVRLVTSGPGYRGGRAARVTVVDTMNFMILSP